MQRPENVALALGLYESDAELATPAALSKVPMMVDSLAGSSKTSSQVRFLAWVPLKIPLQPSKLVRGDF